jgi:rubredoxin
MEVLTKYQYVKVNLPGGIVSSGRLMEILKIMKNAEIDDVSFGSRQQLIGYIKHNINRDFLVAKLTQELGKASVQHELNEDNYPNIITSYCAEEVFATGRWVSEGTYIDILDQFDYASKLKINISDSDQSFTPFFTGNINFVASPERDFWYLYVRPKQTNEIIQFPNLIYTSEIGRICKIIEKYDFVHYPDRNYFIDYLMQYEFIHLSINQSLVLPEFKLPYYEGFNRYGDKTWLGIYRRKEKFRIDFLLGLCQLCLDTKIGQLCTTPWKSVIIKNINNRHRDSWDNLLGSHGINVRHAANELNWSLEDYQAEALLVKRQIMKQYDDFDIRTFGLCFTLQTQSKSEVFGSVIVKERKSLFGLTKSYDVFHTIDFNPNTRETTLFESDVSRSNLAGVLYKITRYYYSRKTQKDNKSKVNIIPIKADTIRLHQCIICLTMYDPKYGDEVNNIPKGVTFELLPQSYCCPVCDASKNDFKVVEISLKEQV